MSQRDKPARKPVSRMKSAPPKDIDEYLARVAPDKRAALEKLRRMIKAAAPKATEAISWGMPAFKLNGNLVCFAAFTNHCSYFPMSGRVTAALKRELASYETTRGTIHFTPDKPLPATLVKKLVRARIEEIELARKKRR